MTLEEYKNEIKELKERLEKLEAEKIEEPQQPKRWRPKNGQIYWLLDRYGNVEDTTWNTDSYDVWQHLSGNCFETKGEAEEYKKKIEYTAIYKNYIEEHNGPLDWTNTNQPKFLADFNCESHEIEVSRYSHYKQQGTIYASSEQIIWLAIAEIGEDNFKKYVLEVE